MYRTAYFQDKRKELCADCIGQFKVAGLDNVRVILD